MAEIGTAHIQIQPSAKGIKGKLEKELGTAGKSAGTKFGSEFEKSSSKSAGSLDSFGTAAILGAAAVGTAFFGLASAAGDLSAAVAANEQVLGDASKAVQDFAETGVESVGLSETAILNAATSFGQLGKVIGLTGTDLSTFSTDLVTAAADMAAFKNVTPTQALEDLQSAFAGQPEVIRKYGIFLDDATLKQAYFRETGERVAGTLTAQQRLVATNAEIWRQGADMWGQAARESGSLERKVADLKAVVANVAADFGAPLVGFASGLIGAVADGVGFLADFNTETGGMLGSGLAASIGVLAAGGAVAGLVTKLGNLKDKFGEMSSNQQRFTKGLGLASIAVGEAVILYQLFTESSRNSAIRTAEVADALPEAAREAWAYAESMAGATGEIDGFEVAQRSLNNALLEGAGGEELQRALGELGLTLDDALVTLTSFENLEGPTGLRDAFYDLAIQAGFTELQASQLANELGSGFSGGLTDAQMAAEGFSDAMIEDVRAMQEVYAQSQAINTPELAENFLNEAAALGESNQALIARATAMETADGAADTSIEVFNNLMTILGEMAPAEREAAAQALGLADAQTDAAGAGAELNDVAASTIDMTTDVEDAMGDAAKVTDAFTSAIDRLTGGNLSLQEAQDEMVAGLEEIAEAIQKAKDGEEGYSLSLENTTEAGRNNREMIRSSVGDVLSFAQAEIEAGHGIDGAAVAMNEQRNALIRQIAPFFATEQAATDYIDQLGLTPDNITTAVILAQQEQAKIRVQDWLDKLDTIPEAEATAIQALIDQGDFAAAESRLNNLARRRFATIAVLTTGGGSRGVDRAVAYGGYFEANNPQVTLFGEAPWDEAMLTVGNPANLQTQLADARIRNPILHALARMEPNKAASSSGDRRERPFTLNHYGQTVDPASISAGLRMARTSG